MNIQAIQPFKPLFSAASQEYNAAVQQMRGLILEGIREPVEGPMDAPYFASLRTRIQLAPKTLMTTHA
jgi:hypothetical protein